MDGVAEERRRLFEAFGYRWSRRERTWVNNEAGRAISGETINGWTLDELCVWLTKGAGLS